MIMRCLADAQGLLRQYNSGRPWICWPGASIDACVADCSAGMRHAATRGMAAARLKAVAARAVATIRVTSRMEPPSSCGTGAGSILGVRNHGREERLAGEVELIWICLEGFLEIP